MSEHTISILEGNTFVVSDRCGNIDASPVEPTGLFSWDTRFLSRWVLTVDGNQLALLSTDELDSYFSAQFFLAPSTGTTYVDADISVIRKRSVGDGFHEDLTIANHKGQPVDLQVRLGMAADFADLFEVKDALPKKGTYFHHMEDRLLILGYRRETYLRETWISTSAPAAIDEHGFTFSVHIGPHQEWHTCLEVAVEISTMHILHTTARYEHSALRVRPDMQLGLEKWHQTAPQLTCDWAWLERIYQRCLVDLAALRLHTNLLPGGALPAAGLPWFMTIFGGVRTMAEGEGGYNPLGYHVGTVWPHDNSIIALGLRRYGYAEEAARIGLAMLEAARFFEGRLPEAFAGYARNLTGFPVEYPTACSPQAWATGTPLLLIRTMLGLEPVGDRLTADPALPKTLGQLHVLGIPGRWGRTDVFGKGRVAVPESIDHLERLMI